MSTEERSDSKVDPITGNQPTTHANALKRTHSEAALRAAPSAVSETAKKGKERARDFASNNRLRQHIQSRANMDAAERTLRVEIYWLERELRWRRAVRGIDYSEKSDYIRWKLNEKRELLKRVCAQEELAFGRDTEADVEMSQ